MANTDKQNIRYPSGPWKQAIEKTIAMRAEGYALAEDGCGLDMTTLLSMEIERFLSETPASTAKRLGLVKKNGPAPMRRRPYRTEVSS